MIDLFESLHVDVLPRPPGFRFSAETFALPRRLKLSRVNGIGPAYLSQKLKSVGYEIVTDRASPNVEFMVEAGYQPEGYELNLGPHSIIIRSSDESGLLYRVVTLLQLLPADFWRSQLLSACQLGSFVLPCGWQTILGGRCRASATLQINRTY